MDTHSRTPGPTPSKSIHHAEPGFSPSKPAAPATGVSQTDLDPLPVAESVAHAPGAKKITAFGKARRHEDRWSRTPNTTGHGAEEPPVRQYPLATVLTLAVVSSGWAREDAVRGSLDGGADR